MLEVPFFKRFTKPKADVELTIPKTTVGLGEDLKGAITVSSKEEFDATEVRAELRCVEKRRRERFVYNERLKRNVRRVYWDHATLHSDDPQATDQLHLVPGFKKTFPIQVNIPAGGRESYDGLDAGVKWSIKGVVAIKGRPDLTSETIELQVIRPTIASTMKAKEVIMVPCEYCDSLMSQTTTSCPNCGAPRKT
jgi:hypothetical protein